MGQERRGALWPATFSSKSITWESQKVKKAPACRVPYLEILTGVLKGRPVLPFTRSKALPDADSPAAPDSQGPPRNPRLPQLKVQGNGLLSDRKRAAVAGGGQRFLGRRIVDKRRVIGQRRCRTPSGATYGIEVASWVKRQLFPVTCERQSGCEGAALVMPPSTTTPY